MSYENLCWFCGLLMATAVLLWWFPILSAVVVGLLVVWLLLRLARSE